MSFKGPVFSCPTSFLAVLVLPDQVYYCPLCGEHIHFEPSQKKRLARLGISVEFYSKALDRFQLRMISYCNGCKEIEACLPVPLTFVDTFMRIVKRSFTETSMEFGSFAAPHWIMCSLDQLNRRGREFREGICNSSSMAQCFKCKRNDPPEGLGICNGCNLFFYCKNNKCNIEDWPSHRQGCKLASKLKIVNVNELHRIL